MNSAANERHPTADDRWQSGHHCPLCASTTTIEVERIPFDRIWRALADDLQASFSDDVANRHTPGQETTLLECCTCRLQYFAPACPGDAEFYGELTASGSDYYNADRWDLTAAAAVISCADRALDIGCGSGRFLEILRDKGVNAFGIDTNPAAVNVAHNKGLSANCIDLATYSGDHVGRFDAVTALHVVEHIAEVRPFVGNALTCLKPGGRLILVVPNRLRRFRDTVEPLDCPPHHISRWTSDQFHVLAALFGCRIGAIRYEPASVHDCRVLFRRKMAKGGAASESYWARAIARVVFAGMMYSLYSRLGWLDRWRAWRMSVLCVLEKAR